MNFNDLERQAMEALHNVIDDARSHEPAIEDAVVQALGEAGAPGEIATGVGALLSVLLKHFQSHSAPVTTVSGAAGGVTTDITMVPPGEQAA